MRSKSKMNKQSDRFYSDSRKKSILAKHITIGLPSPLIYKGRHVKISVFCGPDIQKGRRGGRTGGLLSTKVKNI